MSEKGSGGIVKLDWGAAESNHVGWPRNGAPVTVTLDHIELGALDLWIDDQPGHKLSRAEAARRLIGQALIWS